MEKFQNEQILTYSKGSKERLKLEATLSQLESKTLHINLRIGKNAISSKEQLSLSSPNNHQHVLANASIAGKKEINDAVNAALAAKENWESTPFEQRAEVFLKAADLITTKYREDLNARTMLGQGKNSYQAEIDCICELADFLRFNVQYAREIFNIQPANSEGVINRLEYRALEGFIVAITPFNFTAIAGNLCAAPALLGNTIVWKPSEQQLYSADLLFEIFKEAGLPPGVINMINCDGPLFGKVVFNHPEFSGLHFTGSSDVFDTLWKTIASNITKYKSYPKIVGETGGKDFILAHTSANPDALIAAMIRGAFEYQGQKCSAASRAFIPSSIWEQIKSKLVNETNSLKIGSSCNFENFVNAVISRKAFNKIVEYTKLAKNSDNAEIICGGGYDDTKGYFIQPTIILCSDPNFSTMKEEIFGPVLSVYVFEDDQYEQQFELVNDSKYALTGALFAENKEAIEVGLQKLKHAAGNFYINDKPTGAVVNQQPFGGARKSGTNDKAGSLLNLLNWVSPRTVKTNLNPPLNYRYPFMD